MLRARTRWPAGCAWSEAASPVGTLTLVAGDDGLRALLWDRDRADRALSQQLEALPRSDAHPVLAETRRQLAAYFAGERRAFDVPIVLDGTPFERRAWAELCKIPYGQTISYGEQARRLGDPRATRAVGAANGRNPVSILVPCHRVVAGDGALTGFGGGLARKRLLLELEAPARQLALAR